MDTNIAVGLLVGRLQTVETDQASWAWALAIMAALVGVLVALAVSRWMAR